MLDAAGAVMSAIGKVCPAPITTYGLTFQPLPKSRAAFFAEPSSSSQRAPPAFAPSGFSGEMERVLAWETRNQVSHPHLQSVKSHCVSPAFFHIVRLSGRPPSYAFRRPFTTMPVVPESIILYSSKKRNPGNKWLSAPFSLSAGNPT